MSHNFEETVIPLKEVINISNLRFFISTYKNLGLWAPQPDPDHPLRVTRYFLLTVIGHFFGSFLYALSMVTNVLLNVEFYDLYITLTELGMLGKCSHFCRRQRVFQQLLHWLFTNPTFALRNGHERQVYEQNLRHYRFVVNAYMGGCFIVLVSAGLSSIFSDPISLSYPAWFPVDYCSSRNLAYYVIFVYQNCGMATQCLMNATWDCLMPYMMVNLRSQFQVLSMRIERGFVAPKDPIRTRAEIVQWIQHYNDLVRLVFCIGHVARPGINKNRSLNSVNKTIVCTVDSTGNCNGACPCLWRSR